MASSPRSRAQVAAVLAFVISHTTFLAAQDDETGRCPKVVFKSLGTSHLASHASLLSNFKVQGSEFKVQGSRFKAVVQRIKI